jgi:hypothetical protein
MKEGVLSPSPAAKVEIWQKEGQGRKRRKKPGYISAETFFSLIFHKIDI